MKAVILAAGRGSRLGSLTNNKPKCFTKISNIRLIDWQHHALKLAGIKKVFVITGYLEEKIIEEKYNCLSNPMWNKGNMVSSLLIALENIEPPYIISYSDIIYSYKIVQKLIHEKSDLSISYDKDWLKLWEMRFDEPLSDAETFDLDNNSNILEIGGKASSVNAIKGQFMGLFKISKNARNIILNLIKSDENIRLGYDTTKLLRRLVHEGLSIKAIPNNAGWCEIDSKNDILVANKLVDQGRIKIPTLKKY